MVPLYFGFFLAYMIVAFFVTIGNSTSKTLNLNYGASQLPQGSALGTLLFTSYIPPITAIILDLYMVCHLSIRPMRMIRRSSSSDLFIE